MFDYSAYGYLSDNIKKCNVGELKKNLKYYQDSQKKDQKKHDEYKASIDSKKDDKTLFDIAFGGAIERKFDNSSMEILTTLLSNPLINPNILGYGDESPLSHILSIKNEAYRKNLLDVIVQRKDLDFAALLNAQKPQEKALTLITSVGEKLSNEVKKGLQDGISAINGNDEVVEEASEIFHSIINPEDRVVQNDNEGKNQGDMFKSFISDAVDAPSINDSFIQLDDKIAQDFKLACQKGDVQDAINIISKPNFVTSNFLKNENSPLYMAFYANSSKILEALLMKDGILLQNNKQGLINIADLQFTLEGALQQALSMADSLKQSVALRKVQTLVAHVIEHKGQLSQNDSKTIIVSDKLLDQVHKYTGEKNKNNNEMVSLLFKDLIATGMVNPNINIVVEKGYLFDGKMSLLDNAILSNASDKIKDIISNKLFALSKESKNSLISVLASSHISMFKDVIDRIRENEKNNKSIEDFLQDHGLFDVVIKGDLGDKFEHLLQYVKPETLSKYDFKTLTPGACINTLSLLMKHDLKSPFSDQEATKKLMSKFFDSAMSINDREHQASILKEMNLLATHFIWKKSHNIGKKVESTFELLTQDQMNKLYKLSSTQPENAASNAAGEVFSTVSKQANPNVRVTTQEGVFKMFTSAFNEKVPLFLLLVKNKDLDALDTVIKNPSFNFFDKELNQSYVEAIISADGHLFYSIMTKFNEVLKNDDYEKVLAQIVFKAIEMDDVGKLDVMIKAGVIQQRDLKKLLEHGSQYSPIELYKKGLGKAAAFLVKNEIGDVNQTDINGKTLLHFATENGHIELFKMLLERQSVDLNKLDKLGMSPLMNLCVFNHAHAEYMAQDIIGHNNFKVDQEKIDEKHPHVVMAYMSKNHGVAKAIMNDKQKRFGDVTKYIKEMVHSAAVIGDIEAINLISKEYSEEYTKLFGPDSKELDPAFILLANNRIDKLQEYIANSLKNINAVDKQSCTLIERVLDYKDKTLKHTVQIILNHKDFNPQITAVKGDSQPLVRAIQGYLKAETNDTREARLDIIKAFVAHKGVDTNITMKGESEGKKAGMSILGLAALTGKHNLLSVLNSNPDTNPNFAGHITSEEIEKLGLGKLPKSEIEQMKPIALAYLGFCSHVGGRFDQNRLDSMKELLKNPKIDLDFWLKDSVPFIHAIYNDPNIPEKDKDEMLDLVLMLDKKGKSKIDANEHGDNLLMVAAKRGNLKTVERLIKSGKYDVANVNSFGQNALMLAVSSCTEQMNEEESKIITLLIESDIEKKTLNKFDQFGKTVLHYAYASGNIEIVEKLKASGAKIEEANKSPTKSTLLMAACKGGNTKLVEPLIQAAEGNQIDIKDSNGNTALHYAALSDSNGLTIIQSLLSKGADINVQNKYGLTPLMVAVMNHDIDAVSYLLEQENLDPNIQDKEGNSALIYACTEIPANKELVSLLLSHPTIDINLYNRNGINALVSAAHPQDLSKLGEKDELAGQQVKLKKTDEKGWKGDKEIITMLVERGADPSFGKGNESLSHNLIISGIKIAIMKVLQFFTTSFNPLVDRAADAVIAYHGAKEVAGHVDEAARNKIKVALVEGTGMDNRIDLSKICMVGSYHIDQFGRVNIGDKLQKSLTSHHEYNNTDKVIYKLDQLRTSIDEKTLSLEEKYRIHKGLERKYQQIQQDMVNKVMWPWTRSGLRAAAKEILEADKMILTEYRSQKIIEDNKLLLNMMNGPSKTLLINTLKEKPCKISDVTVKTINDIVRGVKKGELLLSPDIAYDVLNFDKENRKSLNQKPGWFAKKLDPKAIEEINKTPPFNLIEHTKLKAELDDSIKKDIAKNKPQQEKEKQPKFVEARIANLAWMFGMSKEQVVDKIAYASGKVAGLGAGMGTFYALDNKTFSAAITGISATYAALPIAVSAVVWGGAVAGVGAAGYVLYKGAQAVVNLVLQGKEELPTMQQITAENVSLVEMNKFIKAKQEVHEKEASKKESKLQDIKQLDINMDFSFMQPARQTKESDIRYIYTISGEKFGEKVTQDELSQAFKKVAGIHEESSDSTKITYTAKIR